MILNLILRMGVQKTLLQKSYEILVGTVGSNRQFDWIGISLVYNKSDKHLTICDSHSVEKLRR